MTENNNVTDNVQTRTTGEKIAAAFKEWGRKQIVGLKRRPQNIAFLVLAATSIYFLFALFPLSQAVNEVNTHAATKATGICMFDCPAQIHTSPIMTLFSSILSPSLMVIE